jgi:phosphoribosyl-ATP pyrophosphohydrolase
MLDAALSERAKADASQSYTRKLLDAGPEKCAQKLGEEAVEAAIAAAMNDRANLVYEAADVLYHLLVLLRSRDVALAEVMAELQSRTVRSGLAEKASRGA